MKKWIVGFFVAPLVLIIAILGFLLGTETGLHTLLASAQRWAPGQLHYQQASGRILGTLTIEKLNYQWNELKLELDNFHLDWRPWRLLKGQVYINDLQSNTLRLHLPEAAKDETEPTDPFDLQNFQLPVGIKIDNLQLTDWRIWPYGQSNPIILDEAQLVTQAEKNRIQLDDIRLRWPEGHVTVSGSLQTDQAMPVALNLAGQWQGPDLPALSFNLKAAGELQNTVNLTVTTQGMTDNLIKGSITKPLATKPKWQLALEGNLNPWPELPPELQKGASWDLQSHGQLTTFDLKGQLQADPDPTGRLTVDLEVEGDPDQVTIHILELNGEKIPARLTADGVINLSPLSWDANVNWQDLHYPLIGPRQMESAKGQLHITGNPEAYQLTLKAPLTVAPIGLWQLNLVGQGTQQNFTLKQLKMQQNQRVLSAKGTVDWQKQRFSSLINWQNLQWPLKANQQAQVKLASGELQAQGSFSDYQAKLQTPFWLDQWGNGELTAQVDGTLEQVQIKQLQIQGTDPDTKKAQLNTNGFYHLKDQRFDLALAWQQLAWPVVDPQYRSEQGNIRAQGQVQAYQVAGNLSVSGEEVPATDLTLTIKGSDQKLDDLQLQANVLGGTVVANGTMQWLPFTQWQINLNAANIDPSKKWPTYPGRLALRLASFGQQQADQFKGHVLLHGLTGTLQKKPLSGAGYVAWRDQDFEVRNLRLQAGKSWLTLHGDVSNTLNLDWRLDAVFDEWLPTLAGTLKGHGRIEGTRERPDVAVNLHANQLALPGAMIDRGHIVGHVDLTGKRSSQLDINLRDADLGGENFERVGLTLLGTPQQHRLKVGAKSDWFKLALQLAGGWDWQAKRWIGQWQRGLLEGDILSGAWRLQKPSAIIASAQRWQVDSACLHNKQAKLCIDGQGNQGDTQATVDLASFPLSSLVDAAREDITVETTLDATVNFVQKSAGQPLVKARLGLNGGDILVENSDGKQIRIPVESGNFATVDLANDRLKAKLISPLSQRIQGQLDLQINGLSQGNNAPLRGQLSLNMLDSRWLSALISDIEDLNGTLKGNVAVRGTVGNPNVAGKIGFNGGAVTIPMLAARYQDISLEANSTPNGMLALNGKMSAGKGKLALNGEVNLKQRNVKLTVKGERFQAANSDDLRMEISPDLTVTMNDGATRLNGELKIADARIRPQGLAGSGASKIAPSDDVVLTHGRHHTKDETVSTEPTPLYVRLRVILGKDVFVEAYDFQGTVSGNLLIEQSPGLVAQASGSVEVGSGNYILYGQQLSIERGAVHYSNSPLDNPTLDIKVSRAIDTLPSPSGGEGDSNTAQAPQKIIVGAEVDGPLRKPNLRLTSEPPLPENVILSYLIFGVAPQLDSAQTGSSLVLGKYLTPDLFVGYGVGLFGALNTFILRYNLFRKVQVEATSNEEYNALDFLYTIDFN